MTGEDLKTLMMSIFGTNLLFDLARKFEVIQRDRRFDLVSFVLALVFTGGTEECGRQYAVMRNYFDSGAAKVVRGAFYAWFDDALEKLISELLRRALDAAQQVPKLLPGILGTVSDWRIIDSTTVALRYNLIGCWIGSGNYAAVKIHKEWSSGSDLCCKAHQCTYLDPGLPPQQHPRAHYRAATQA